MTLADAARWVLVMAQAVLLLVALGAAVGLWRAGERAAGWAMLAVVLPAGGFTLGLLLGAWG